MTQTVFIDGAAGTTGLEIAGRLTGRSEFELITLDDAQRKDDAARRDALNAANFVILCLPDDAARAAVAMIDNPSVRVIDASSAHRTADGWTYGFAELRADQRQAIASAARVSNPGCYPTGFLAVIAPLVAAGLIPADFPYSCNAVSGYSGGGKELIARFGEAQDIGWRGYGYSLDHKHLPEMQIHAGLLHTPLFAPAVVRAYRGMVVEAPLNLAAMGVNVRADDLRAALAQHYNGSAVVGVSADTAAELLIVEGATANDRLELYVFANQAGELVRLAAMLDNLGKGAAGAAVQNLNIMAGLPETSGLNL